MIGSSDGKHVLRFQTREQIKLNRMKQTPPRERVHSFQFGDFVTRPKTIDRVESEFVGTRGEVLKSRGGIGAGCQSVPLQEFPRCVCCIQNEAVRWRPAALPS